MYGKKSYFACILCYFLCIFSCIFLCNVTPCAVYAAEASPPESADLLPSIEITPEQMQKYFPAPLSGNAKNIPLTPGIVSFEPLKPSTPQGKTPSQLPSPTVATPSTPKPPVPTQTAPANNGFMPSIPETHDGFLNFMQARTPGTTQRDNRPHAKHIPLSNIDVNAGIMANPANPESGTDQPNSPLAHNLQGYPSLEIMIGQMIMAGFTGTDLESGAPILTLIKAGKIGGVFLEAMPPKDHNTAPAHAPLPMLEGGKGGFNNPSLLSGNSIKVPILQQGNITSPSQLRMLIAGLQRALPSNAMPLFVAVEQEGGAVQSLRKDLGFEGLAAAAYLGQGSVEKTEIAARRAGLEMAGLGINFVLGPAGDVNVNPLSESIGQRFRSFGVNEGQVAQHVQAFIKGLLAAKVLPCVRNFPGTGSVVRGFISTAAAKQGVKSVLDSIPDMAGTWNERELLPYKQNLNYAIQPALIYHRGLDALRPVPLSAQILNNILRGQLGFNGLIVSEDLRSLQSYFPLEDSILQAIQAGTDILLITEPAAHAQNFDPLQGFGTAGQSKVITEILGSGGMEQGKSSTAEVSKMLLKQSLGKVLPGAFQADIHANPTAGMAGEAAKVYNILLRLVKNGSISHARIAMSWQRIQLAKKNMELY